MELKEASLILLTHLAAKVATGEIVVLRTDTTHDVSSLNVLGSPYPVHVPGTSTLSIEYTYPVIPRNPEEDTDWLEAIKDYLGREE